MQQNTTRNFDPNKIIGFDIETCPVASLCPSCGESIHPQPYDRGHMYVTDDLFNAMGKCPVCDSGVLTKALANDPDASPPIFSVDFAYYDDGEIIHDTMTGYIGAAMTFEQLLEVTQYIKTHHDLGFVFAGANLVKFDFAHLAHQSGQYEVCIEAAMSCIDPTILSFCHFGYPISLDACAQGLGIDGKAKAITIDGEEIAVSGAKAWDLWRSGDAALRQASIEYLQQDTEVSLEVGTEWARSYTQVWRTAKGKISRESLTYVGARYALSMRLPDTSWMKREPGEVRPTRLDYIQWIQDFKDGQAVAG